MTTCACGTPSEAAYYAEWIIGRGDSTTGTETEGMSAFYCADHAPDAGDITAPDGWYVIEATVTELDRECLHRWVSGMMYVHDEDVHAVAEARAASGSSLPECEKCETVYAL